MYCHDLEVVSSNPSSVELGVRGCLSRTGTKNMNDYIFVYLPGYLHMFAKVFWSLVAQNRL